MDKNILWALLSISGLVIFLYGIDAAPVSPLIKLVIMGGSLGIILGFTLYHYEGEKNETI